MIRVTNQSMSSQVTKNITTHSSRLNSLQNKITTQNRIQKPSEDPNGMSLLMSYRSQIQEYTRYEQNISEGTDRLNVLDTKIQEVISYIQEIRQHAVQGANGVLTQSDKANIASQVEQYLRQIAQVANSKYKGESLFAGHESNAESYQLSFGKVPNWGYPLINEVQYQGDTGALYREIDRGEYLEVNIPGNRVFWSSQQRIHSQTAATGYIAHNSIKPYQTIQIDNAQIRIDNGDNLQTIVDKINHANIPVHAQIDNTSGQDLIVLQSTQAHQIILKDLQGGHVLQDIGLITKGSPDAPNNYAPSAIVSGESLFDTIIQLRNALFKDDINTINRSIGAIDEGLSNLTTHASLVGSRQKRLELAQQTTSKSILFANEAYSKVQAVDFTKAITEMKNTELSHQAALQIGARLMRSTLLNYLR